MDYKKGVTRLADLGSDADGQPVEQYQISNGDLVAVVTNFGATLLSLKFHGQELTLNWPDLASLQDPLKNPKYGATCGRVAGRISKAKFSLNDEDYELEANNGPNCLHGGSNGFDRQTWKAKTVNKMMEFETGKMQNLTGIEFKRVSPHLEEGFPAEIVVYSYYLLS